MKLSELPRDVLRVILDRSFSFLVLPLYFCGDRLLNDKLENGGIEHLELASDHHYSTSRWPKMIKHLKLKSLSISRAGGEFGATKTIQGELKEIMKRSTQLESLKIASRSSVEIFFGLVRSDSTPVGSSSTSDIEKIDWNARCPTLTHLELIQRRGGGDTGIIISPLNLALLPSRLVSLTLLTYSREQEYSDLSMFPRLERIETSTSTITPDGLSSLPSSITSINNGLNDEALTILANNYLKEGNTNSSTRILPHLALLPASFNYLNHSDLDKLLEKGLPQRLGVMKSWLWKKCFSSLALSVLPSSLTTLILTKHTLQASLNLEKAFPPSLTKLKVRKIDWESFAQREASSDSQSSLPPPSTTSHHTPTSSSSSHRGATTALSIWPPLLEKLSILQDDQFSPFHFALLPHRLRKLSCNKSYPLAAVQDQHSNEMEATLLEKGRAALLIPPSSWNTSKVDERDQIKDTLLSMSASISALKGNREAIKEGRLFGLPLSITRLRIFNINTQGHMLTMTLPPTCTKATMAHNLVSLADHFFASLPSSLSLLALTHLPFVNSTWSDALSEGSPLNRSSVRSMTLNITTTPDKGEDDYDYYDSDQSYDFLTEEEGDEESAEASEPDISFAAEEVSHDASHPSSLALHPAFIQANLDIFAERLFGGLPRALQHLCLEINFPLATRIFATSPLPESLTFLMISAPSIVDDYEESVRRAKELKIASLADCDDSSPQRSHWFSLLPQSLKSLVIQISDEESALESVCMRYAPRGLEFVQFQSMTPPSLNDVANWPPHLKTLNIFRVAPPKDDLKYPQSSESGERSVLKVLEQSIDDALIHDAAYIPLLLRFRAVFYCPYMMSSRGLMDFLWGCLLSFQYLDIDPRSFASEDLLIAKMVADRQRHLAYRSGLLSAVY